MNNLVRSIMMVTLVVLAVAGSVFVTLQAAEPNSGAPQPTAAPDAKASRSASPDASAKSAPNAKPSPKPRAPAPIVDEPTVAPDSQESADNSVAFPADI